MIREALGPLAMGVLFASAIVSTGATSGSGPVKHQTLPSVDSLEVRVTCDDYIALTLRDPRSRVAFCAWDSARSTIPGCRAFSMVEVYDEMGEDGEFDEADSVETAIRDTTRAVEDTGDSLGARAGDVSLDGSGTPRFVVLAPQAGEWTLEARVPARRGYVAATLWLDVRVAPHCKTTHVSFAKWAELKPGGRVWSKLRVGRDGSVVLVRTVRSGEFVWSPTTTR